MLLSTNGKVFLAQVMKASRELKHSSTYS